MLTGQFCETTRRHKQMVQQGLISGDPPAALPTNMPVCVCVLELGHTFL